jgi:hypothetical protein
VCVGRGWGEKEKGRESSYLEISLGCHLPFLEQVLPKYIGKRNGTKKASSA